MLDNVQSLSMVLTGNSVGIALKFGINTTNVAMKMGKISPGKYSRYYSAVRQIQYATVSGKIGLIAYLKVSKKLVLKCCS